MKRKIPVWQLKQNIAGVRIDKVNEAYFASLFEDISKLHRNDHFVSLLLTSGSVELLVDCNRVYVVQQRIVFLVPGQIQRAVNFETKIDGWILFIDDKLVDDHARLMIEDSLLKRPILELSSSDVQWFTRYFELLLQTFNDETLGSLRRSAVSSFVTPFINKVASSLRADTESMTLKHSRSSLALTKTFKQLVRMHYRDLKKPSAYAHLMNFSIGYLNDTIKSVTGFPATYFIQQEMLREGQRMLCHTDLSLKEVSSRLGFDDANYFNRVFTKLTGHPPGRFRNDYKTLKL